MPTSLSTLDQPGAGFAPVHASTGAELQLAMQRLWLTGQILPAGARLMVQHVFRSQEKEAVEVIYAFALPRDAALRRFRVEGEGFSAHSELKPTGEATEVYEAGIAAGSLSALVRQYGDGIVNLTLGNLRPEETVTVTLEIIAGVESHDQGFRFRFPFTLAPCYHSQARAIAVEDGVGEMELPPEFGDLILPRWMRDASSLHAVGFDLLIAADQGLAEIGSPSHTIRVGPQEGGSCRVSLARQQDAPDRDLVLDASFPMPAPQVFSGPGEHGKVRFVALVPSTAFGPAPQTTRRVVVALDRSSSMGGLPMSQAKKAVQACLDALSDSDCFGLVTFSDSAESFRRKLVLGSRENREAARRFLDRVEAAGGTELAGGVIEAARVLGSKGGDIFILTDGQVWGTEQIVARARAAGARLHCLGIGSASQDRFLAVLARETGGQARFLGPRESIASAALDLFASASSPVVSGLTVRGASLEPPPPLHVYPRTPLLLYGHTNTATQGQVIIEWNGGALTIEVPPGDAGLGETIRLLHGARLLTDLEFQDPPDPAAIRALSETYGLQSREMSLVAVVRREGDQAGALPKTIVTPVGMPQDTAFHSYFDLAAPQMAALPPAAPRMRYSLMSPVEAVLERVAPRFARPRLKSRRLADALRDLASRIEPDGGMPGRSTEERALATMLALLAFLAEGHAPSGGRFRVPVERLIGYLESVAGLLPEDRSLTVSRILRVAREGKRLAGNWLEKFLASDRDWSDVEVALENSHS